MSKTMLALVWLSAAILFVAGAFGVPEFCRYQLRETARNKVLVTEIEINNQDQLVEVEKKKAEIRTQEAHGIAASQKIINATLTDKYLQHEAIKAQEKMAGSPSHSVIYIPSGQNGIPLVRTVDEHETTKAIEPK